MAKNNIYYTIVALIFFFSNEKFINNPFSQLEDIPHSSYDREDLSHMMPPQQSIHYVPCPIIPHSILQRPPNQITHSPVENNSPLPTTPPASTPSPSIMPLVSECETVNVHSIPTVSALSTGPELDLADLNQKALLSSANTPTPNSIMKSKFKAQDSPASYPNADPNDYPKHSKFFPEAVETPGAIESVFTDPHPFLRDSRGELFFLTKDQEKKIWDLEHSRLWNRIMKWRLRDNLIWYE